MMESSLQYLADEYHSEQTTQNYLIQKFSHIDNLECSVMK
jgi:hypothetical protein